MRGIKKGKVQIFQWQLHLHCHICLYSKERTSKRNSTKTFSCSKLSLAVSLWRTFGPLFFPTLLQFIHVCGDFEMHNSLKVLPQQSVELRSGIWLNQSYTLILSFSGVLWDLFVDLRLLSCCKPQIQPSIIFQTLGLFLIIPLLFEIFLYIT